MYNWTGIINEINKAQKILIFTHINMDGDAVGSAASLCIALRKMGKDSFVFLEDTIPDYLSFLEGECFTNTVPFEHDLSIAVDIGSDSRLENRKDLFYKAPVQICIDHHIRTEEFCNTFVVDADAPASGNLVLDLLRTMGVEVDQSIARCLYVAMLTDTGSFKYGSTTAQCLRDVAELFETGIDHAAICNQLFSSKPMAQLKLEHRVFERAEEVGKNALISYVLQDDYAVTGAKPEYSDTCIDSLRIVEGVEIAAILKERGENVYKLSMRAKNYANVRDICSVWGGGGHEKASGATLNMSLEEALCAVKTEIERALYK